MNAKRKIPANPRELTEWQLKAKVRNAVKGSTSSREAYMKIHDAFSPPPLIWVNENGPRQFRVFLQPCPGVVHHEIICER